MIKKFTVTNFMNFREKCEVDFSRTRDYSFNKDLLKDGLINKALLYGRNGSGKSNLGLAMMDITNHLTDKYKDPTMYRYFRNAASILDYATFTFDFLFTIESKTIEFSYQYEKKDANTLLSESILVKGKTMFAYNYVTNKYLNNFPEAANINLDNRNQKISAVKYLFNNSFNLPEISPIRLLNEFANNMLWFRSVQLNQFIGNLDSSESLDRFIIDHNLTDEFQSFLHDCGIDMTLKPIMTPAGSMLFVIFSQGQLPFFQVASTGTLSLALFFYWLHRSKNHISFLYLDEFDAFYHTSLSKYILNQVNQQTEFQSMITSHNTYLADNTFMRPDCYLCLKDGVVKSFADLTNKVIREGHNLENMLLGGEFE